MDAVWAGFAAVERGVANELNSLIEFLNRSYAPTPFERVEFREVQQLAGTCGTGCHIVDPGSVEAVLPIEGFVSRLVSRALGD